MSNPSKDHPSVRYEILFSSFIFRTHPFFLAFKHHRVVIVIIFLVHLNLNNLLLIRKSICSRIFSVQTRIMLIRHLLSKRDILLVSFFTFFISVLDKLVLQEIISLVLIIRKRVLQQEPLLDNINNRK